MVRSLTRYFHAFSVWLTVATLATSSVAAPVEARAPERRIEHTPRVERNEPRRAHPTERLGVGRDGHVSEARREEAKSTELRGDHALHRIASERRTEQRPAEAPRAEARRPEATTKKAVAPTAPPRDWSRAPAIVEHSAPAEVFAVSDLHGRFEESFHLFEGNKILRGSLDHPELVEWTGGNATVVVVGDVINKGGGSLKMIDMLRALQKSAESQGGKVIVTMGNHEASFLHEPLSDRSLNSGVKMGIGTELRQLGASPETVALGADAEGRGAWLRELPFAAKVNEYFFVHSGSTHGLDRAGLAAAIERSIADGGFGHDNIIGDHPESVLGADDWRVTASEAKTNAEKLGVKHIVMGHIPNALDAPGTIARSTDGALIKLDTGLGNGNGEARMLRIGKKGGRKQVDVKGARVKVKRQ